MLAAGAITPLVCMLMSSSADVTSTAARVLVNLTVNNTEGQAKIVAAGALAPLAVLLKATGPAQMHAARRWDA